MRRTHSGYDAGHYVLGVDAPQKQEAVVATCGDDVWWTKRNAQNVICVSRRAVIVGDTHQVTMALREVPRVPPHVGSSVPTNADDELVLNRGLWRNDECEN